MAPETKEMLAGRGSQYNISIFFQKLILLQYEEKKPQRCGRSISLYIFGHCIIFSYFRVVFSLAAGLEKIAVNNIYQKNIKNVRRLSLFDSAFVAKQK